MIDAPKPIRSIYHLKEVSIDSPLEEITIVPLISVL